VRREVKLGGYPKNAKLTRAACGRGSEAVAAIAAARVADIAPIIAEVQAAGAPSLRAICSRPE
jgi:hypothetical protein